MTLPDSTESERRAIRAIAENTGKPAEPLPDGRGFRLAAWRYRKLRGMGWSRLRAVRTVRQMARR